MADAPLEPTTTQSQSFSRYASSIARATFAVLGVVVAAYLLLSTLYAKSGAETQARYARAMARFGQELEARYASYGNIIETTTSVLNQAGDTTPSAGEGHARLKSMLLPSYARVVDDCSTSEPGDVGLCVARASVQALRDSGRAEDVALEILRCDSEHAVTHFTNDAEAIIFAPRVAGGGRGLCGRIATRRLISAGALAESDGVGSAVAKRGFADIVLLAEDGRVVYEAPGSSDIRVAALPQIDSKRLKTSGMVADLAIGIGKYRAFIQPIAMRIAGECARGDDCTKSGSATGLVLAGLVDEARLHRESYSISPEWYFWILLLLGFSLLALPLAKVWLPGPTSRLGRFDVLLLAGSAVAATLLSVVLVLALLGHIRLASRLDTQLQTVGASLKDALERQLHTSIVALDELTAATADVREQVLRYGGEGSAQELEAACGGSPGVSYHGEIAPVCERVSFRFDAPELRSLKWGVGFWANARGEQQVKYTEAAHSTFPINVRARGYFRRAYHQQLACLLAASSGASPSDADHDSPGCRSDGEASAAWSYGRGVGAAEVVRSATSGDIVLVVARPTFARAEPARDGAAPAVNGVLALETKVSAFDARKNPKFRPILPLGVQAAIVDDAGVIMLHSDNEAYHGQNLFDDIDAASELRATIAARASASMSLRYLGVPSRASVLPVPGVDWAVVVFAPRSLVNIPTANAVIITLVAFGAVVALAACLLAATLFAEKIWRWRDGSERASRTIHLRPNARHARVYAKAGCAMIACTVVVAGLALIGSFVLPTTLVLAMSLGIAFAALASVPGIGVDGPLEGGRRWVERGVTVVAAKLLGTTKRATAKPGEAISARVDWRDSLPVSYALCLFGLAGVCVVTPAVVLFAGSFDHVAESVVRTEGFHFARALRGRASCTAATPAAPGGVQQPPCPDVFGLEAAATHAPKTAPRRLAAASCALWPLPCVLDRLPPLDTVDEASGRLYRDARWARVEPLRTALEFAPAGPSGHDATHSLAPVPLLAARDYDLSKLLLVALAFAAFLGVIHACAYHTLDRLFFLHDLAPSPPVPLAVADFATMWSTSSAAEQRALGQLVVDGYVNPDSRNRALLARWRDRGVLDPASFTVVSRELEQLVMHEVTPANLAVWAGSDEGSLWTRVRAPLATSVALLLAVVTTAAPDLMAAGAVGPTIAVGLPTILRVLNAIAGGGKAG